MYIISELQCAKYTALLVALSFVKAPTIPADGQNFNGSASAWLQVTSNGVETLTSCQMYMMQQDKKTWD
jgi:hypothetical protein